MTPKHDGSNHEAKRNLLPSSAGVGVSGFSSGRNKSDEEIGGSGCGASLRINRRSDLNLNFVNHILHHAVYCRHLCAVAGIILLVIFPLVLMVEYLPIRYMQPSCLSQTRLSYNSAGVLFDANVNSITTKDKDGKIRYKHTKRRLPTCLVIGVRKSGTRALLEFLNIHPSIQAARKEIHFFDNDENFAMGFEWYRKRMPFSFPDQVTTEKTPKYFTEPLVPERVRSMNSSIKLLLIVRDPVDRAISDYTQVHESRLRKNKPHASFEEFSIDSRNGEVDQSYPPIRRSIYSVHMKRWLRCFSLDQIHLISGQAFVEDPFRELRKVENFLGLEHKLRQDHFYYNKTRGFYCIRQLDQEKCLSQSKGRKHPEVNSRVLRTLRQFFKPYNEQFYQLVGRDFGWPTE